MYYCLKIKVVCSESKIYSLGLLFFKVFLESDGNYQIIFIGKPQLLIQNYYPKENNIDIRNSWKDFESIIRENIKNIYSKHLPLYNSIYKKIHTHFYKYYKETGSYKRKKVERLIKELKDNADLFLSTIWLVYKNEITTEVEEVSAADFEVKEGKVLSPGEEESDMPSIITEGRAPVDWGLGETEILYYLPVISINEGIISKKLNPEDKIWVCLEGGEQGKASPFPYVEKILYPVEVIDKMIDSNQCLRLLVKLENESYGDVEIYDDLIKVKAILNSDEDTTEEASSFSFWPFIINSSLVVIFIIAIYLLIKSIVD